MSPPNRPAAARAGLPTERPPGGPGPLATRAMASTTSPGVAQVTPSTRLPLSQPAAPRDRADDDRQPAATDTARLATDPTAPCRALTAYLIDLASREARGVQAGEAAMLAEQRSIARARQVELRCPT